MNNILGWFTFAIAAVVYLMTIEPTASFWDCGEFISSAYKLEVGHPPGSPIFMLTANLFTQLASDPSHVAKMVNAMSALFSALTILFLFWTITYLAKKIIVTGNSESISLSQAIMVLGAGLVGSLAYTFSDTFWFSAVEGEVYAYSSLFTAAVFWLILKWESVADKPHADRWIVLIAYLMGLSIAVHLLNLLCIPAIVLVYYFKKYPDANLKGSLIALGISFAMVALLLYGLVSGVVKVCGWVELLFVNVLGFPYNSGVLFYVALVFGVLIWSIWETVQSVKNQVRIKLSFILSVVLLGLPFFAEDSHWLGILLIVALAVFFFAKKNLPATVLNTTLTCLLVIMIGYSSYALTMIRSVANTPMDQNSPEDIFSLSGYLNREQYGERPLFYGNTYVSEYKRENKNGMCDAVTEDHGPNWSRVIKTDASEKDRYVVATRKIKPVYQEELNMFFPRMFSKDHVQGYKEWANIKGKPVKANTCNGEKVYYKPTFAENMRFFFSYQINFMYWRYFMWNFSGRQNDIQGKGNVSNGNWITGIKFIDEALVGPQDDLPYDIAENKGHNKYYMLPLLLGILGILFQLFSGKRGEQGFWITFLLFFMMGIAIVIYLNQKPGEPRERDYAYAGSFYAFCIWLGLGVPAIAKCIHRYAKLSPVGSAILATALCLFVPLQMGAENWDDHDRSNRYVCRDVGFNYLSSCAENAIIFTHGDNDTFPLWYAQEVEGFRRDVRVCNLSYLQTDWYINQMKMQAYESMPLPIGWKPSEYATGKAEFAYLFQLVDSAEVGAALKYARMDDQKYKQLPGMGYDGTIDIIPSKKLYINIDSASVVQSGLLPADSTHLLRPRMVFDFSQRNTLSKPEMMILEMLNNAQWQRPIYYATTTPVDMQLGLTDKHFRQEGLAYRIVPFDVNEAKQEVGTDIMYDNMMHKFKWGGVENPNLYLDENTLRMIHNGRYLFSRLAVALIMEDKKEKAIEVLDHCQQVIPPTSVRYAYDGLNIANCYHEAGAIDKAIEVYEQTLDYYMKSLNWYYRLNANHFRSVQSDYRNGLEIMRMILSVYQQEKPELLGKYMEDFARYSRK
ncbi:MAG: DUF2723 domain-containing protein [Dysgonamonadaceae bacterium]|jgi:hypothetical protein|nr:DUF2723 domain-containing protein [Dysgonamonadaceae bacterium]